MKKSFTLGMTTLALTSQVAWGAVFSILNRSSDLATNSALYIALNAQCDALEASANNGFLSATARQSFVDGIARSNQSAESMLTIDRASKPGPVDVGIGTSLGAVLNGSSFTSIASTLTANSLPAFPGIVGASFIFGTNFSSLGAFKKNLLKAVDKRVVRGEKFMLFVRGMYLSSGALSTANLRLFNIGANLRYRLIEPHYMRMGVTWGGLNFGAGANYSISEFDYAATLSNTSSATVSGETATVTVNLPFSLGARSSLFQIPIELSTSFTFIYFFTFYAGAGADLAFGSSSLVGTTVGNIASSYTGTVFVGNLFSGNATVAMDDGTTGRPSTLVGRGFAGLQFNIYFAKLGLEYNILTNGAQAVGAFFRFAVNS